MSNPALENVNTRDYEDCPACVEAADWPCAYHEGMMAAPPGEGPKDLPALTCSMCGQKFWTTARTDYDFYRDCPVIGCAGYLSGGES